MDRTLVFLVVVAVAVSAGFAYTLFGSFAPKLTEERCSDGGGHWDIRVDLCQCGTRANLTCPEGYSCAYKGPESESPPGYCVPIPPEFFIAKDTEDLLPSEWRTCETDSDCIPLGCCHQKMCVNTGAFPNVDCAATACTEECQPDTLDCGQGQCICQEGLCSVEWLNLVD